MRANVINPDTGEERTTNDFYFTWCRDEGEPLKKIVVPRTYQGQCRAFSLAYTDMFRSYSMYSNSFRGHELARGQASIRTRAGAEGLEVSWSGMRVQADSEKGWWAAVSRLITYNSLVSA